MRSIRKWLLREWVVFRYLTLPLIVGTLPNNIQNGQTEDAVPVMANYNWIVNQVNANAAQLTLTPQLAGGNAFAGNQSITGNLLVSGSGTVSGVFKNKSGSVAINNGVTATLFAVNALEVWLVTIRENGGNVGFGGTAVAGAVGAAANVATLQANNGAFAVSGANLQYNNLAGSNLVYDWTAIRTM